MGIPGSALLFLCILIIKIEYSPAAVPASKDDLIGGSEYQVDDRQNDVAAEEKLLEELVRRIEEQTLGTGHEENKGALYRGYENGLDDMQTVGELKTASSDFNDDPTLRKFNGSAVIEDISSQHPHTVTDMEVEANKTAANEAQKTKEAVAKLVSKATKKIAKKVFEKSILKFKAKAWKLASRILAKMAKQGGGFLTAKLGLKAGKQAAKATAKLLAKKTGEKVAASGGGMTFSLAAKFAYDCLSIALDLADVGGYMKMGTIAEYKDMRDSVNTQLKKAIEENGGEFPVIAGPLDKLTDSDYEKEVNETIYSMLNPDNNNNPIIGKIISKLDSDISSNQLTDADSDNDVKMGMYANMVEPDDFLDVVCTKLNGKLVETWKGDKLCSYKNREICEESYDWPLKEDSDQIYAEYKDEVYGGACVTASYALRGICESNHLGYSFETGMCNINETYCKMKGAEWQYNKEIKEYDCVIPLGQSIAEKIFGTTIIRGLKQIFDFDQYEDCRDDETDDGYFCRSVSCKEGEEQWHNAGICYPKCKPGYHYFGCCICSPDCPEGWTDDGATCRRAGYCEPDKEHDGALCYDKCRSSRDNGVGPVCWVPCPDGYSDIGLLCSKGGQVYTKGSRFADKKPCPDGMRDDGTSCWRDTYGRGAGRIPDKKSCPSGMRDDGTSCWRDTYGRGVGRMPDKGDCPSHMRDDGTSCWIDAHIYGKGCCCTWWGCCNNCNDGYADDGCTCRRTDWGIKLTLFDRQTCMSHEEKCLALCYHKCRSGYHPVGCNLCAPNEGAGIKVTAFGRYACHGDEELHGALCYPKCKAGYRPVGCCLCEPNEGPGIKVTLFQRQYCSSHENLVAGVCWSPCPSGTVDDGALCRVPLHTIVQESYGRGVGTPDTVIKGKAAAYGRGVGTPAVKIRVKKRKIPFSTKNSKKDISMSLFNYS